MRGPSLIIFIATLLSSPAFAAPATLLLRNDDTQRVVVPHAPELNPTSSVTLEAWVRPSDLSGCRTIIGKRFDDGYWLGLCSGILRHYASGSGSVRNGSQLLTSGTWWHIAATYDGEQSRLYVNGELDAEHTFSVELPRNDAPLGIGGEGASDTFPDGLFPFAGYLSEARLWRVARTEEQIQRTMYEQIVDARPGLVAVWSLEAGAGERFGNHPGALAPDATVSGLDSPPQPFNPLKIRPVSGIEADGDCNDPGYASAVTMPVWYPEADRPFDQPNPQPVLIGADASYLYVCLPRRVIRTDQFWAVEIDTQNDGGVNLADDDYRFRLWPENDGLQSFIGSPPTGGPFGTSSWEPIGDPAGLFADFGGVEFEIPIEFRIPRSILPDPAGIFRLRVLHSYLNGSGQERRLDWPVGGSSTNPSSWQEVEIDLAALPRMDGENPSISAGLWRASVPDVNEVEITYSASDDVDIELIELLVDGVPVESVDLSSGDDVVSYLGRYTGSFSPGLHELSARVEDQAGRTAVSRRRQFRILVDGEAPEIDLSYSPATPAPGEAVTVTADVTDDSGVKSIVISDALGGIFPARRCDFSTFIAEASCTWVIEPDPLVAMVRLKAFATDNEDASATSNDHVVLFGNSGPDRDNDGLADAIEAGLCTDPNSPDTDLDGLSDGWEITGIHFANGELEPLVNYGVHPCRRDLLLQVDSEELAAPSPQVYDMMRSALRDNGIKLYLETHDRERPTVYRQSHLKDNTAVYQTQDGEYYFDPKRAWAFLYAYNRAAAGAGGGGNRFSTVEAYEGTGGFCSSGPRQFESCRGDFECPGTGAMCRTGCDGGSRRGMTCSTAADCPLDDGDFASCTTPCRIGGGFDGPSCDKDWVARHSSVLFHEVGHTAGLGHGGPAPRDPPTATGGFVNPGGARWNGENYKPNYISVMNYLYNSGLTCMEPVPDPLPEDYQPELVSVLTLSVEDLGSLDEDRLNESSVSPFAQKIRSLSCSHASHPDAFPVFKYSCSDSTGPVDILSDGRRTLARRLENWTWSFDVPEHGPGIDWNCNGVIDSGTVAQSVNQNSSRKVLESFDDHLFTPTAVECQRHYRNNCAEPEKSCYTWPEAYENAIPTLATGVEPLDCREWFLANRNWCPTPLDSEFGTGRCPEVSRDLPFPKNQNKVVGHTHGGGAPHAHGGKGDPGIDPDLDQTEAIEGELPDPIPGEELCDLVDNDDDGDIDEGCADVDGDGVPNPIDNCQTVANPDQADRDRDGLGDSCQAPQLSGLQAMLGSAGDVQLSWNADTTPNLGYTVYRYSNREPSAVYLGDSYPSTMEATFAETPASGQTYTYVVRPVNLNGDEGEAVSASVAIAAGEDLLFEDGFE